MRLIRKLLGDPMLIYPPDGWRSAVSWWLYTSIERPLSRWSPRGLAWRLKQRLAGPGHRYYGDGGTLHSSGELDVCTDRDGNVTQVWFRCQLLAFRQARDTDREIQQGARLSGVEVVDEREKSA